MLNCGHIERIVARLLSYHFSEIIIFCNFSSFSSKINIDKLKQFSTHLLQGFNHLQRQNIPFWYMKKLFYLKIWLESEMVKNKQTIKMTFFVQKCHIDPPKFSIKIWKLGLSLVNKHLASGWKWGKKNFRTYFGTVSTPDLGWMSSKLKSLKKSFEEFRCILDLTFILNSKTTSNDFKWPQLHKHYDLQIS